MYLGTIAPTSTNSDQGRLMFMHWLKIIHPNVYAVFKHRAPKIASLKPVNHSLHGLGETPAWVNTALDIVKGVVPMVQQQKIFKAQLERANHGLPPLKSSEITPPGVPIQVQLPPAVQREVTSGLSTGRTMLIAGTVGALALVAFMMLSKKRRG